MGTKAQTAGKTATVSTSATGTQAKGNYITINTNNIRVLKGYVVRYNYEITEIGGNKVPVKYWDFANKQICRITILDNQAYLVEYIYTDKDGGDQKARKVLIPGKDGVRYQVTEKDGYKNYILETSYVSNAGTVTPSHRFTWSTKIK